MTVLAFRSLLTIVVMTTASAAGTLRESREACLSAMLGRWKVVRDGMPEIYRRESDPTVVIRLTAEFLKPLLLAKLSEELKEFRREPVAEELADLLEVAYGVRQAWDFEVPDISFEKTKSSLERERVLSMIEVQIAEMRLHPKSSQLRRLIHLVQIVRDLSGFEPNELEEARLKKLRERGAFLQGYAIRLTP